MRQTEIEAPARNSLFTIPPALRYPAYRNYWLGSLASVSGFQMFQFGQLWLMHELTRSPLFLGYVGLANAIPAITLNLFGGVLADRLDKRRLIMVTQSITASLIFVLAVLTLFDAVHWSYVLIVAFLAGGVNAFDQPARQALYPHLIDRSVMMSAVALNSSIWQGTRIVAPALAGIIIATLGTANSFFLSGAGFVTLATVIYSLKIPKTENSSGRNPARDMLDGLKFISKNTIFAFLISMTFFNSFFGMSYMMLMPVFAVEILRVGADGQGVLMGVSGAGALIATLYLGSIGNFRQKGLVLIGGATVYGILVVTFALTSLFFRWYLLALVLMFAMGVFRSVYMISIMSTLQMMVPDRMRGRVMGFYGMTYSIMPLGGMQAGTVAFYIGAPFAVALGGLAVAAFALGPALLNRKVRNVGATLLQAEEEAVTARPRH